jgi:hypothetical protein
MKSEDEILSEIGQLSVMFPLAISGCYTSAHRNVWKAFGLGQEFAKLDAALTARDLDVNNTERIRIRSDAEQVAEADPQDGGTN